MKTVTAYGNFSKGQIDHDMNGRFDLPIYSTGMDIFQNFISNYKGNAIFSAGFISKVAFQDCAFVEFKFGNTQNYLCAFYTGNVQFLAFDTNGNFGWVLNGSSTPLIVTSPYTLADAKFISQRGSYTQNADVMYLAHRSYAPYKLTRTSANSFTLATYTRTADPFWGAVNDTSASSNTIATGPQTFTVSSGQGYAPTGLIKISSGANSMSGTVTSYSGTTLVVNITSVIGSGTFSSWVIVQTANWPGATVFYKGRLFFASTLTRLTSIWFSNAGLYDDFTIQNPLTDASGFAFTITDITQQIEWLFPGDNSLIAGSTDGIVAINGGAVNTAITPSTVQANITSAEPTNGIYPLKRDGLIFYPGRTSRNMFYFKYDILSESFLSSDANLVAMDITKTGLGKIRFKHDRQDLIFSVRGDSKLISFVFKPEPENINGWHLRTTQGLFGDIAVIGDNVGNPQLFILVNRNGTYYIEQQSAYVEFAKQSDFWTEGPDNQSQQQYEEVDREAYIRYVSEQLRQCVYLDNAIYFADLRSSTITFTPTGTDPNYGNNPDGTLNSSAADFSSADVGKFIVYKTATGYESGRYVITGFTDTQNVSVSVVQLPVQGPDKTNLYTWSAWYKSFTTLNGISQYNGMTVGVVTEGGYLETVAVSGDTLTVPNPVTSICVGYRFTGVIKSMTLGFQIKQYNTQVTFKNISQVNIRCTNTMGLKAGPSLYNLEDVQLRKPDDINYLPPAPIDGTTDVNTVSDGETDQAFYIVQDQPLPACITNVAIEADYALSS